MTRMLTAAALASAMMATSSSAQEVQFVFRHKMPTEIATAEFQDPEPEEERATWFRATYSQGWILECETDWTAEMLEEYRPIIETRFNGAFADTNVLLVNAPSADPAAIAAILYSSMYVASYRNNGTIQFSGSTPNHPNDGRDFPPDAASWMPCRMPSQGEMRIDAGSTEFSGWFPMIQSEIYYR